MADPKELSTSDLLCGDPLHSERDPGKPGNEHLAGKWFTVLGTVTCEGDAPTGQICAACAMQNHIDGLDETADQRWLRELCEKRKAAGAYTQEERDRLLDIQIGVK